MLRGGQGESNDKMVQTLLGLLLFVLVIWIVWHACTRSSSKHHQKGYVVPIALLPSMPNGPATAVRTTTYVPDVPYHGADWWEDHTRD